MQVRGRIKIQRLVGYELIFCWMNVEGTGGTLSGTSTYLRSRNPDLKVILSDPEGSGLFNKVKFGVMFDIKEREGRKRRHQVDTIVEGIGKMRAVAGGFCC